ncbi:hypothetical protein IC575_007654 [Cucumis melo]
MEATSVSGSKGTVISEKGQFRGIRIENPFTLQVGQIFTGFGVGCGVGIGVGRPINMGAIPVMNELMSATRGATDVFSGITRQKEFAKGKSVDEETKKRSYHSLN